MSATVCPKVTDIRGGGRHRCICPKNDFVYHVDPDRHFKCNNVHVCVRVPVCSRYRDFPCNNITTEWEMPRVNPALIDMLDGPEWTAVNPSPGCQCSTPRKLTMLPVCPEGAGGLTPPQVSVDICIGFNSMG